MRGPGRKMGVALPGFGTLAVGALCVSLQFAGMVFAGPGFLRAVMLDPGAVWLRGEAWRLFTSALFHAGLFHLAINMISHVSLGGELERRLGTLKFLAVTLLIMLCSSVMYVVICLALSQLGVARSGSITLVWAFQAYCSGTPRSKVCCPRLPRRAVCSVCLRFPRSGILGCSC